ncbi:hypothetical protein JCM10908_002723 [Rhodotorula pacifica]|uniref:uncharacterized protein n=1 Tax=Rhodotorula pacifica TaxID=1495444 RepID=UPI0031760C56
MLPRSSSPDEPLLRSFSYSDDSFPPPASAPLTSASPRRRRRPRRLVVIAASGTALLALALLALTRTNERAKEAVAPYRDRLDQWAAGLYHGAFGSGENASSIHAEAVSGASAPSIGNKAAEEGNVIQLEDDLPAARKEEPLPSREWSEEDQRLRYYTWQTPPVHSSLERLLAELTPAQNRTRQWLLQSRNQTLGGTGIGLGAADPPQRIRPAPPLARHSKGDMDADTGPGLFTEGSYEKYFDLVSEWRNGQPVDACENREWESAYTELHADMLEGRRTPSLLEYRCRLGEYCGGFADRILGMTTLFLYSMMTNRAFSVSWEQPVPADLIFDSPHIDWSRPFNNTSTTPLNSPIYTNETLIGDRLGINAHNWPEKQLDKFMPTFVDQFGEGRNSSWLQMDFNRGIVMRSFSYPKIKPYLDKLGLRARTAYSCLVKYLFRPKPAVLAFIAQYTSVFSLPDYFVIGIQIRTGDLYMYAAREDVINTVEQHSQYFTCADAVARAYAQASQKVVYYLITDSHVLEEDALRTFGDKIVVTGFKQAHPEIKNDDLGGWKALTRAADGFMRTIAESYIFAGTDFQITTKRSGFGKIPTWLRGRENTTIPLFNPQTDPDWTFDYRKKHNGTLPPPIDCSKPEAVATFHGMAQEWSLG